MSVFESHGVKEYSGDPIIRVTPCGRVAKRVNINHPERRQWLEFTPQEDKDGYLYLVLLDQKWRIHRLVYSLFVGPLEDHLVVCHRDNDRKNNHFSNLLQETQRVNVSHKIRHGTHQKGNTHPRSIHTEEQADLVKVALKLANRTSKGWLARGEAQRIANQFSTTINFVRDIDRGRTWK